MNATSISPFKRIRTALSQNTSHGHGSFWCPFFSQRMGKPCTRMLLSEEDHADSPLSAVRNNDGNLLFTRYYSSSVAFIILLIVDIQCWTSDRPASSIHSWQLYERTVFTATLISAYARGRRCKQWHVNTRHGHDFTSVWREPMRATREKDITYQRWL
jgi:hypothetical protein